MGKLHARERRGCPLKWLENIVERNGPVSQLPVKERGDAAELVIELELCKEGIRCDQVKRNDARDRIAYRLEPSLRYDSEGYRIESFIQMKYLNYTTESSRKHGKRLQFSDMLMDSPVKPDYIILVEDPIGEYKFLVLTNMEMMEIIEEQGKRRPSDPNKTPRMAVYVPRRLSHGWLKHSYKFRKLRAHPMHNETEDTK